MSGCSIYKEYILTALLGVNTSCLLPSVVVICQIIPYLVLPYSAKLFYYQGWPRITEQTCIADRQRPLSTSGKSTHIPWFISIPKNACGGQLAERRVKYRHVHKIIFRTFYGETTRKTYEKTTLFVICYRLIIFAVGVFLFEVPVVAGSVFLDYSSDGIDFGRGHNCSRRTTP